ncbi:MAG: hypothetical protein IJB81_07770 [Clostridia bacterium]|nr:hypothetical protein [Clostridia bacterium]
MAAEEATLPVIAGLPERVEIVSRTQGDETARFVFNNDVHPKTLRIAGRELNLAPFEMAVITEIVE